MSLSFLVAQTSAATSSMSTSQWFFIGLIALGTAGFAVLLFKMKPQA